MVNTNKKIAAGLLALTFVFGGAVLPTGVVSNNTVISASAEELTYGNFTYTMLEDGTIEISKYTGSETAVEIPSEIDGVAVTSIGKRAFYCTSFKRVIMPYGITNIGDEAFDDSNNLVEVTIPDSVVNLGDFVFMGCDSLEHVVLSKNLTSISQGAFRDCEKLTSVTIPYGVTVVGDYAFEFCPCLESVELPNSITSIGYSAFGYGTSLKNINIPEGTSIIGEDAFRYCAMSEVVIPDSVTRIERSAFYSCKNLKSVYLPDGLTYLGDHVFCYCSNLESINIPKSLSTLPVYAFYETGIIDIAIPESVTTIGKNAFHYYDREKKVYSPIPDLTISCYSGSYAEQYAIENGINYKLIYKYPEVTDIDYSTTYHQFRLSWTHVDGADKYGIAAFIAGKWRVQTYTDSTTFTSPKLKAGDTYKLLIAARVNGEWDLSNINSRAFTVTVK
jgi:hypothetical protein